MFLCDRLFCPADFFAMALLAPLFLLPLPNCFLRVCLPRLFAAALKFFLPRRSSAFSGKLQQVSTHAFCSWDDILTQKGNCGSPKRLCTCTESPPTMWTNSSLELNLYFSWSNHLVTSFRWEMNNGAFLNIKIKRVIPTDTQGIFSLLVFLNSIWILGKEFLNSGLNSNLELRNKRKATQQWSLCVAIDIVLNHDRLYHERVRADVWFVRSFASQHYSKFKTNITSENLSQIRTKRCKTRSFICKVNLNF